jgi:hypothetical protein
MDVPLLRRSVHVFIFVYTCTNTLEIGIEKMKYTVSLSDFDWGMEKVVSLQGVFNIR